MTTILAVRRESSVALGGDGQVTLGTNVVKHEAVKIRRLHETGLQRLWSVDPVRRNWEPRELDSARNPFYVDLRQVRETLAGEKLRPFHVIWGK